MSGPAGSNVTAATPITSPLGQRIKPDITGGLTHDIMHDITRDMELEVLCKQ